MIASHTKTSPTIKDPTSPTWLANAKPRAQKHPGQWVDAGTTEEDGTRLELLIDGDGRAQVRASQLRGRYADGADYHEAQWLRWLAAATRRPWTAEPPVVGPLYFTITFHITRKPR